MNAEFQRIARIDKKTFVSNQWKEIKENERIGQTRDLFKKIRDTKGRFHANMGSINDINCRDLMTFFIFMHWRRKWQPTSVVLPGESQGWGSLVGCRLWGCTESDTTEVT